MNFIKKILGKEEEKKVTFSYNFMKQAKKHFPLIPVHYVALDVISNIHNEDKDCDMKNGATAIKGNYSIYIVSDYVVIGMYKKLKK